MAVRMGQTLRQGQFQNQVMTPQLQQAIKMLTLTHLEMTDVIAQEMVENPLLEEVGGESTHEEVLQNAGPSEAQANDFSGPEIVEHARDDFDWDKYVDSFNTNSSTPSSSKESVSLEDTPNYENMVSKSMSLWDHLEWQVRMEALSPEKLEFASLVIGNIDQDGFLEIPFEELLKQTELDEYEAQDVMEIIQNLDPVGCASVDTKEALLIQARLLEQGSALVEMIIEKHLDLLYRKEYEKISKEFKCTLEEVKHAEMLIMTLQPRPGRAISSDETHYVVPDIYVKEVGDELVVELNDDGIPELRISKMYRSLIAQYKKSDPAAKEYLQEKLRSAMWLIKSIENRQRTIHKVMEAIVRYQPEFFRKGAEFLKPMILKNIAEEIGVHESTVSRVTTNKFVRTSLGTFELKYFFSSGLGGKDGGQDIASESLKLKIKQLIQNENPTKPLSDDKISALLEQGGINVARRTVAKYRESLGILSSAKRRK